MAINRQLNGASCYLAAFTFVIIVAGTGLADKLLSPRFSDRSFPAAAVDFVLQNQQISQLTGKMYSHDQFGGYLIYRLYPQFKVFVDGRSDFYRQGAVLDEMDKIVLVKPGWDQLLDERSVDWMLLKRREPLAQVALYSGKWASVYEDSISQVLVRQVLAK